MIPPPAHKTRLRNLSLKSPSADAFRDLLRCGISSAPKKNAASNSGAL